MCLIFFISGFLLSLVLRSSNAVINPLKTQKFVFQIQNKVKIKGSFKLSQKYYAWLNFECALKQTKAHFLLQNCEISKLPIPDLLTQKWLQPLFENAGLKLNHYISNPKPPLEKDAHLFYYQQLIKQPKDWQRQPFSKALANLFKVAQQRGGINENSALLSILGAWASKKGLVFLVPEYKKYGKFPPFRLKLAKRRDFAKHFLISAALTTNINQWLSQFLGLYKEMNDTTDGSGFSFTDMAANMAGTQFGAFASKNSDNAKKIQDFFILNQADNLIMPFTKDLPENLNSAQFKKQFIKIESPAYQAVIEKIKQRLAKLRFYQK